MLIPNPHIFAAILHLSDVDELTPCRTSNLHRNPTILALMNMQVGKSKRRFKSFKSLFRIPRAGTTTGSYQRTELLVNNNPVHFFPDPLPTPRTSPTQLDDPFGDRKRTEKRYITAVKQLHETLAVSGANWALPPFDAIANYASLLPLREEITRALDVREGKSASDEKTFWSLIKKVIERAFVSVSPFAMNVLQVLKQGSNVFTFMFGLTARCLP